MIEWATLRENLIQVQAQIAAACATVGRSPDDITLVAVSKTHPAETVLEAARAGITDFGENRLEEALPKIEAVARQMSKSLTLRWHMVGHVQSRKARLVVPRFDLLHSLDSAKLAGKLSRLAEGTGVTLDVLLEINVSGEASKYGWQVHGWEQSRSLRESLWSDIQSILSMEGIRARGLMTMAPLVPDPEQARPVFVNLRRLRDALQADFAAVSWDHLSMGMSDDFQVAVEEGATMVRIGRAIFGPRRAE